MIRYRAIVCALALSIAAAAPVAAAEKKPPAKAAAKAPPGRTETLACRLGTEDRHARIAVVVIRGKTDSFAYYSKWKPRTCSVYLQRKGDMYSKWADNGNITTVSLDKGAFLIEHKPGEYHFIFRDIDRERYCGMDGVINGSLTIKRGSDQCVLDGEIMVEGTPLGQAFVARETEGPLTAGASDAAPAAAASPAEAPPQKPSAAGAPAEKPSASSGPAEKPSASSAPAEKPSAVAAPAEKPQAASEKAAADKQSASDSTAEKPSATQSGGSVGAFFRSLKPNPPEAGTP